MFFTVFPTNSNALATGAVMVFKGLENHLYCTIWKNRVFDIFILADELFPKVLQSFKTCVSANL